ncbi:MAG: hypothetical protein KF745_05635 [Phycisphaeraceae bacterium]|nr:hypothetical protein [Phycisphaeraceae bacterium]
MADRRAAVGLGVAVAVLFCGGVRLEGGTVPVVIGQPTLDRWMYPFNSASPLGTETEARTFSPLFSEFQASFDNRDGEMLLGYTTSLAVTPGLGTQNYRVLSARVVARVSRDQTFTYDGTQDPVGTYYPIADPQRVVDADAGRPVELFGVGYRNGFTALTFQEESPHSFAAPFPDRNTRNAFAAQFDGLGNMTNVQNNVDDRFEVRPFAVGTAALTPGVLVPVDTDFTFELDVENAGVREYLARSLDQGRLNLMVTSLAVTQQQQSGEVPYWYTKEYPSVIGGVPARLEMSVCIGPRADWDCNGTVEPADIAGYINRWAADVATGRTLADFDANGVVEPADIAAFVNAWVGAL